MKARIAPDSPRPDRRRRQGGQRMSSRNPRPVLLLERDRREPKGFRLILPPSEPTCRRLGQDVASPTTLRDRKVINTKYARWRSDPRAA
jgi:hypothetical protein